MMSDDLDIHESLVLLPSSVKGEKWKERGEGANNLLGGGDGGLICVMFFMVLLMLVALFVLLNTSLAVIQVEDALNAFLKAIDYTHIDFEVTPTINADHYNGIMKAGGTLDDYTCVFQDLSACCTTQNNGAKSIAYIFFQSTCPYYEVDSGHESSGFDSTCQLRVGQRRRRTITNVSGGLGRFRM
jgi:Flp pilus assembly protein TadG